MGFRFQRPFRIVSELRANFSESGLSTTIGRRGAWSTTRPLAGTGSLPGTRLSYVVIEQSHDRARALGLVVLIVVLAALAFVAAAQG
jgi:Protein of unknown function (DUF4236)